MPFRLQNVLYLDQTHLWPFTKRTFSCLFRCGFMFISCRFDYVLPYAPCAAVEWMWKITGKVATNNLQIKLPLVVLEGLFWRITWLYCRAIPALGFVSRSRWLTDRLSVVQNWDRWIDQSFPPLLIFLFHFKGLRHAIFYLLKELQRFFESRQLNFKPNGTV